MGFGESWGDAVQWSESINARYFMSEPGATWIHHWAYKFLNGYCNMGVQASIAFTSRVAGFLYLLLTAVISNQLLPSCTVQRRLLFRIMHFVSGLAILFFGYVENTPLALPAEMLWVVTSVSFFQSPSNLKAILMGMTLALATLIHGRTSFYAPALAVACIVAPSPMRIRLTRAGLCGIFYVALIASTIIYIKAFEFKYVIGGPWGNVTGGGNRQMFTPIGYLLSSQHWSDRGAALFMAGGLLSPIGLLAMCARLRRMAEPLSAWIVAYCGASLIFVSVWEFDYGPAGDWDLIFSAVNPFLILTALTLAPSRLPVPIVAILCSGTAVASLFFGTIVNGRPFQPTLPPTAAPPSSAHVCTRPGLERTYFTDRNLSQPLGPPEVDIPNREWANDRTPLPTNGRPFGARYQGYLRVPAAGRYRVPIMAQGNVRLIVGERVLFERWYDLEVRVTIEREIAFPAEGLYPISVEFFSTTQNVPLKVSFESNKIPLHTLTIDEVCS